MAHLKKRGRYYSIRFYYSHNGEEKTVTKSLGTRHKDVAQKMLRELEQLESLGKIDPLKPGFNPKQILKAEENKGEVHCSTVKDALELFYQAKQHLSPSSVLKLVHREFIFPEICFIRIATEFNSAEGARCSSSSVS